MLSLYRQNHSTKNTNTQNLEGSNESISDDFLGVENFDLHHTVEHLLRPLVEAEVQHLIIENGD